MALIMACEAAPSPLVLLSDSIVDDKALVPPVGTTFAGAMNGTAFQNDILVSHNGWQSTAWDDTVGTDQSVWIGRRTILTAHGSNFAGEPRLDHARLRKCGVLSVFISEGAPSPALPTPVLTGGAASGTTTGLEVFDIPETSARMIRYVGYGNSLNPWNSLTEATFELAPPQTYLPDAHTLQLWHLDEAAPPFAYAANPAHPLSGLHNGALTLRPAPPGFGSCVNFNTGTGTNRGIVTSAPTLSSAVTAETPASFAYHGPDGAFTIEALVRFDTPPGSWASGGQNNPLGLMFRVRCLLGRAKTDDAESEAR